MNNAVQPSTSRASSSAVSDAGHLLWMAEPDGRVTYLNRSAQDFFQVDGGKDPDAAWLARIHPEDRVAVMSAWQRSLKTGSRYRYEFRFVDADGRSRRCLAQALPMRNEAGKILRWLGSTMDLESYYERVPAPGVLDICYQLLRHETSFSRFGSDRHSAPAPALDYRQIMEFLPIKAWSATPDGEVDFVNLQWREYTDITTRESLGQGWINAVHADDREPLKAAWRQIMDAGTPGSVDYRLRHHDGTYRRCNSRAEPIFDETGKVQRWIGTVVDLENRYSLQSSLGESEARHQQLLEHLPELFLLVNPDGRVLDANKLSCERLGHHRDALIGMSIDRLGLAIEDGAQRRWASIRPSQPTAMRFLFTPRDGNPFPAETIITSQRLAGRAVFFLLARDVSEREAAETRLRQAASLIELAPVTVCDIDGRIELWSAGAEATFGYRAEEAVGQRMQDLLDVKPIKPVEAIFAQIKTHGSDESETLIRHRDGSTRRIRNHWALSGPAGNRRILNTHIDVTAQREAEAAARAAEDALLAALALGSAGTWSWDIRSDQVQIDYATQRLLGAQRAQLSLEMPMSEVLNFVFEADRSRVEGVLRTAAHDVQAIEHEYRALVNGEVRWILVRGGPDASGVRWSGITSDITAHRQARDVQTAAQTQLRAYASQLNSTLEQERAALARELHDELGQRMTALRLDLRWLDRHLPAEVRSDVTVAQRLSEMDGLIDETLSKVRHLSASLRPQELEALGLRAAMEAHAAQLERRAGIRCRLNLEASEAVAPSQRLAVFRVFQEAMTNGIRHGGATRFKVQLTASRSRLRLRVEDNGNGLPLTGATEGFGIIGMTERAHALGGNLEVSARRQGGTAVTLKLPCVDCAR